MADDVVLVLALFGVRCDLAGDAYAGRDPGEMGDEERGSGECSRLTEVMLAGFRVVGV